MIFCRGLVSSDFIRDKRLKFLEQYIALPLFGQRRVMTTDRGTEVLLLFRQTYTVPDSGMCDEGDFQTMADRVLHELLHRFN